jgi:hypothetical protein
MALDKTTVTSHEQSGGISASVVNLNLYVNAPLTDQVLEDVQEALVGATESRSYGVLICPPSELLEEEQRLLDTLKTALQSLEFDVYLSESPQSDDYVHFEEADFVSSGKCNSVIILAKDFRTISQLNIYTFLKKDKGLSGLDIPVIQISFPEGDYFSRGCLAFISDEEKVFDFQSLSEKGISDILDYLKRRRTLSYRQTRGIKKGKS